MKENLKIGNVQLQSNIILAPMAGVTDTTFRSICKEMGAGLVYTEMVSAKGLYYKDIKTKELMKVYEDQRPLSLQIFGSDPDIMSYVVESYINDRDDIDIIDVNMGCPTPKIVKNGDGSSLMRVPHIAGKIIRKIKNVTKKPITAKIRAGWDKNSLNAVEFAKVLEFNGVDMITVHGRTREQFYTGKVDLDVIKNVKQSVAIPVVGNGDIFNPIDALNMIEYTNCDGVMIARGILGNPWLIKNISELLHHGNYNFYEPTPKDKVEMTLRHAKMLTEELNEKIAALEMRKFASWYLKGIKNSSQTRGEINKITSSNELYEALNNLLETVNN